MGHRLKIVKPTRVPIDEKSSVDSCETNPTSVSVGNDPKRILGRNALSAGFLTFSSYRNVKKLERFISLSRAVSV